MIFLTNGAFLSLFQNEFINGSLQSAVENSISGSKRVRSMGEFIDPSSQNPGNVQVVNRNVIICKPFSLHDEIKYGHL